MTALVKGQNVPWADDVVTVLVHHAGDVSALLLGADEQVRDSGDLVFYNQPRADAATWSAGPPQSVHLDLAALDRHVVTVRVVVSTDPGTPALGAQPAPRLDLFGRHAAVATFTPGGLSTERALVVCEVYRRGDGWKVRAVGQGYDGGLAEALTVHGVQVDDPAPVVPAPAAPPAPAPAPATPAAAGPGSPPPPGTTPHERLARQASGVLEDASRSTASLRSTTHYASTRLEQALEQLVADPRTRSGADGDAARAAAQRDHDVLVGTARANHRRDMDQLRLELGGLEAALPAPMAAWTSPAWQQWQPTAERSAAVRLGTLSVEDAPGLAVPMLLGLPLHVPVWVDASTGGQPAAARVLRSLGARVLAAAPPGTFAVTQLDLGSANPAPMAGLGPVATDPAGVLAALEDLVRFVDMVEMAYQSGHPEALDELDGRPRLLLVHDVPTGLDDRAIALLHQLVDRGAQHGVQVVMSGTDSAAVPHPHLTALLASCRSVPSGPGGVLTDGFGGTSWDFTPDTGPDDAATLDLVLPRLVRR